VECGSRFPLSTILNPRDHPISGSLCCRKQPTELNRFEKKDGKMRYAQKLFVVLHIAAFGFSIPDVAQEAPMDMSRQHMHHHGNIQPVEPVYPHLGSTQAQSRETLFSLDDAQRLASESNPTLRQAEAEIRAAKARSQQAALYPNPSIGYIGDEIRGGSINGGKQGFFVEQSLVTAGKLSKARVVFEKEARVAELNAEAQKTRVETSVKIAFYRVLAAQELLELRRNLNQIGVQYQQSQKDLVRTGQVDESESLETEIDVARLHLAVIEQEGMLREEWRRLAALIGQPDLPQSTVTGDLEHGWPDLDEQHIVQIVATQSPVTRAAEAASARASAEIARAQSQVVPDVNLLGGLEYNNEPLGSVPHAIGWEGIAELSVQIPVFNRNQGNIAGARAELDRAQLEQKRIQLVLCERAASVIDQYATSKIVATQYRDEILPRAKQANTLMTQKYGQMLAAYPRMLEVRRKHFQLAAEYVQILESVWTTGTTLQGFLLTDGLAAPSHARDSAVSPADTNLEMPQRTVVPIEAMPHP
jgi:cobalt-zinc-cadmium efflux system outer membrane protein